MSKPRVKVPKSAKKGEIITIKSLIKHNMETGNRKNKNGEKIPRLIINEVIVTYNDKEVMKAEWFPSVSANPYLQFNLRATESGTIAIKWIDDDKKTYEAKSKITVA